MYLTNSLIKLLCLFQAAEKRKKLLDELAIKSQEDSEVYKSKLSQLDSSHKQQVQALHTSHKTEITALTQLLEQEKVGVHVM